MVNVTKGHPLDEHFFVSLFGNVLCFLDKKSVAHSLYRGATKTPTQPPTSSLPNKLDRSTLSS